MFLPAFVDKTPNGDIKKRTDIGGDGYAENFECELSIILTGDGVTIDYYCEDLTYLDDQEIIQVLELHNPDQF